MQAFTADDHAAAIAWYDSVTDANARRLLDFLIDHPGQQRTAADLQQQLGFAEHRDVARATYHLGTLAAAHDRARPWSEGQLGYRMPEKLAALFRQARQGGA